MTWLRRPQRLFQSRGVLSQFILTKLACGSCKLVEHVNHFFQLGRRHRLLVLYHCQSVKKFVLSILITGFKFGLGLWHIMCVERLLHDRLILTQDDDVFTELEVRDTAGVGFQQDQTLSTREVGDAVHEMSQWLDQHDVALECVSRNWL